MVDLKSYRRTIKAGSRPNAIRGRVLIVARDKGLPDVDIERALKATEHMKSNSRAWRARGGFHLSDFAGKHGISLDWLFWGDIRGLALMTRSPGRFAR